MTTNRKIQIPNFKNIQKKNLWDETPIGETMKLDNTCFVPFIEFPALLLKKLWILYQNRHNNSKSHFVGRFAQHTFVRQNKTRQSLKLVMEDSEENDRFCNKFVPVDMEYKDDVVTSFSETETNEQNEMSLSNLEKSYNYSMGQFFSLFFSLYRSKTVSESDSPLSNIITMSGRLITPRVNVAITPINQVKLLKSNLALFLLDESTQAQNNEKKQPETGFLTIETGRNVICLQENDPKAYECPLIGIWVKGTKTVNNMYVCGAIARYLYSRKIKSRTFSNDEKRNFLIISFQHENVVTKTVSLSNPTEKDGASSLIYGNYSCFEAVVEELNPIHEFYVENQLRNEQPSEMLLTVLQKHEFDVFRNNSSQNQQPELEKKQNQQPEQEKKQSPQTEQQILIEKKQNLVKEIKEKPLLQSKIEQEPQNENKNTSDLRKYLFDDEEPSQIIEKEKEIKESPTAMTIESLQTTSQPIPNKIIEKEEKISSPKQNSSEIIEKDKEIAPNSNFKEILTVISIQFQNVLKEIESLKQKYENETKKRIDSESKTSQLLQEVTNLKKEVFELRQEQILGFEKQNSQRNSNFIELKNMFVQNSNQIVKKESPKPAVIENEPQILPKQVPEPQKPTIINNNIKKEEAEMEIINNKINSKNNTSTSTSESSSFSSNSSKKEKDSSKILKKSMDDPLPKKIRDLKKIIEEKSDSDDEITEKDKKSPKTTKEEVAFDPDSSSSFEIESSKVKKKHLSKKRIPSKKEESDQEDEESDQDSSSDPESDNSESLGTSFVDELSDDIEFGNVKALHNELFESDSTSELSIESRNYLKKLQN